MSTTGASGGAVEMEDEEQLSPRQTSASMQGAMDSLGAIKNSLGPALDERADPDAQATVTDFLEFTEHLPADMTRSLTLIGKLDNEYADASTRLHDLTKLWGQLPTLPAKEKPQPAQLRADISDKLNRGLTSRVYSQAEAVRMADNINRHVNRLKLIHAKLCTMLENYPADDEHKSPARPKSPQLTRGKQRQPGAAEKGRRPLGPRITVPGEVLAPYDVGYDTYSGNSESSEEEEEDVETGRKRTPAAGAGAQKPRGRKPVEKPPKAPKLKLPKPPAVAAQVTGSNPVDPANLANPANPAKPAVRLQRTTTVLRPPPENAVAGSEDAPWLQLTLWELSKLRKRMKKNSAWVPSDTMINRELKTLGRGYDGWSSAKKAAEEAGVPFEPTLPQPIVDAATGSQHLPMGAVSLDSALAAEDKTLTNRGHELNKAKKIKKNRMSDQAAKEAEESARRFALVARNFQVSFQQPQPSAQPPAQPPAQPAAQPATKKTKRQQRKRKRDSVSEADAEMPDSGNLKRSKTETPVPIPQHISLSRQTPIPPPQLTPGGTQAPQSTTPVPIPLPGQDQSIMVGTKSSGGTSPAPSTDAGASATTTTVPVKTPAGEPPSPSKTITPALPSVRETRARDAKTKDKTTVPPPIKTTGSRGNTPGIKTPSVEPARRPSSRGQGQEAPGLAAERSRRASTARNTPAPDASLRQPSKRTKRPAPGIISRTNSGGNSAITKRKAAPKKSKRGAGAQKKEAEAEVEVDEEGNVIDPNEARYCVCNRVSFGTMVMCENENVSPTLRTRTSPRAACLTNRRYSAITSGFISSAWGSTALQCCLRRGTVTTARFVWAWKTRLKAARGRRDAVVRRSSSNLSSIASKSASGRATHIPRWSEIAIWYSIRRGRVCKFTEDKFLLERKQLHAL